MDRKRHTAGVHPDALPAVELALTRRRGRLGSAGPRRGETRAFSGSDNPGFPKATDLSGGVMPK